MNRTVKAAALGAMITAFCGARAAHADGGLYVGGNAGYTLSSLDRDSIDSALSGQFAGSGAPLTINSSGTARSAVDWSAEIGYMFLPYVGVEAGYLDLGSVRYTQSGTLSGFTGTSSVDIALDDHSRGPALTLRAVLPMTEYWFLDAHLGAYEGRTSTGYTSVVDASSTGGVLSKTRTSPLVEAGTGYVFGSHWTLRADFVYINRLEDELLGSHFNVQQVTAGLTYTF